MLESSGDIAAAGRTCAAVHTLFALAGGGNAQCYTGSYEIYTTHSIIILIMLRCSQHAWLPTGYNLHSSVEARTPQTVLRKPPNTHLVKTPQHTRQVAHVLGAFSTDRATHGRAPTCWQFAFPPKVHVAQYSARSARCHAPFCLSTPRFCSDSRNAATCAQRNT